MAKTSRSSTKKTTSTSTKKAAEAKPDTAELERALIEDRQRREQACWEAIQQALEEHRCELTPEVIISGTTIDPRILINAR